MGFQPRRRRARPASLWRGCGRRLRNSSSPCSTLAAVRIGSICRAGTRDGRRFLGWPIAATPRD